MRYKTVEQWYDGEFYIMIEAKFKTKGYNKSSSILIEHWVDCVDVRVKVIRNNTEKVYTSTASAYTHYSKKFFFSKKQFCSLQESYEMTIEEAKKVAKKYIENNRSTRALEKRDQLITDGLPDSLKNLQEKSQ